MLFRSVLVHGFRPQVNEQLAAKGHAPKYSHGIRITDSVALDCDQEAAGQLRYEIEAAFSQGLPNTPMAGATVRVISGNFITARPVGIMDGVDFQHSGLVRKVAMLVIVARVLDLFWLIAPEIEHEGGQISLAGALSWQFLVLPASLVALWVGLYMMQLRQRPLLPG